MRNKISLEDKKTYIAILLLALFWLSLYAWWKYEHPTTWHYKTTVTVETPEGVKTGFAVREANVHTPFLEIQGLYDRRIRIKGEAVVVDLGARGLLFSPMNVDDYSTVFAAFPDATDAFTKKGLKYYQNLVSTKAKADLPPYRYPRLAMFRDINDPKTVTEVNPLDLSATYGAGVHLKSITIEMTDEKVTWGIDKYLSWLPQYVDQRFDGDKSHSFAINAPLANQMGSGYFSSEAKK